MEILVIYFEGCRVNKFFFFLLIICKMKERKELILIFRFLVRVIGRMNLLFIELVNIVEGKRFWGED